MTITSAWLCPRDRQALYAVAIEGANACAKCGGLWLTREALMAQARRDPCKLMGSRHDVATSGMPLHCPKDGMTLKQLRIEQVQIDICPGCFGAWLAKGELAKIRGTSSCAFPADIVDEPDEVDPALRRISDWIHDHWPTNLPDSGTD